MSFLDAVFVKPIELLLGSLFVLFANATASHGVALLLLSLAVTLITAPLYYLAEKWKAEEQVLQARMARDLASIKTHYTGQKRFYLVRNVHRLYGYKPIHALRTSLGLAIQIPFFFAAYHYLSHYSGYAGVPFLFLRDLSRSDGLLWGANLLPFVMTAVNLTSSLLYTRLRSARDGLQLFGLALFFLVVLYDRPAALLVYWTMNNVLSIPKSMVFARILGSPAEAKAAEDAGGSISLAAAIRRYVGPADAPLLIPQDILPDNVFVD